MSELIHIHCLSPGLVKVLTKLIWAVKEKDKNEVHLQKDVDLSHNEYANCQKLRYFALIAQVPNKSGYWLITKFGGEFLRNERAISYKITTQNNRIIAKSEEERTIKDYYPAQDEAWFQQEFGSFKIDNQISLI